MEINFIKTHPEAKLPFQASEEAAGHDLFALSFSAISKDEEKGHAAISPVQTDHFYLHPPCRVAVHTGLKAEIPAGFVGLIMPRSGLAVKYGVDKLAGVIDSDYRGEIVVILQAESLNEIVPLKAGDAVAQLVIVPVLRWKPKEADALTETVRAEGGFGSTDKLRVVGRAA